MFVRVITELNQLDLAEWRRSLIKPLKSKLNSFDIVMAITRSLLGAVYLKNLNSN
ncbi:hypothetical protein [Nostoc sp.]|uniref:hypothetical protein n=1 Tax=Nostoc sp. TaxID=1180 RepID=UPI002FF84EA2